MKTYEIKDLLKKEILIIELPRLCDYHLYEDMLYVFDNENDKNYRFRGAFTLLGKPDEIGEDDAEPLVQKIEYDFGTCYRNYTDKTVFARTAKESLLSLLESEIYWDVNPLGTKRNVEKIASFKSEIVGKHLIALWHEAEQKTFDRNRSIILVKN